MKKIYFTLITILSGLTAVNAQTITQANHAPLVGDSYSRIQVDSTAAAALATITGSNTTWNFATPNTRTVSVVNSYTTSASITSTLSYPASSIVKLNGPEKAYYVVSSTGLKFWGGNVVILGNTADFVFSSGVTQANYPMVLNDFTNTTGFTGTISSTFGQGSISNGVGNVTYDGFGTLNLPSRAFANVVRLKTTTTFDFNLLTTGNIIFENYDYYDLSVSKHPLLSVSASTISSGLGTSIQYYSYLNKDYLQVGINESVKEIADLNIFPNPTKNNFNIKLSNENAELVSYEIYNMLGQSVKKDALGSVKGITQYNIETSLQPGVYFVKVAMGNATTTKKITIQ